MIGTILLVFAFLCLLLAAVNVGPPRVQFGWLGLAFWVFAELLGAAGPLLHR